jgi:hypothetical protein
VWVVPIDRGGEAERIGEGDEGNHFERHWSGTR